MRITWMNDPDHGITAEDAQRWYAARCRYRAGLLTDRLAGPAPDATEFGRLLTEGQPSPARHRALYALLYLLGTVLYLAGVIGGLLYLWRGI